MLLCGGKILKTEDGLFSEVAIVKKKALEMGIPDEDILLKHHIPNKCAELLIVIIHW